MKNLSVMFLLAITYSAHAQVSESSVLSVTERTRINISNVFNSSEVGVPSATFVDPLAICRYIHSQQEVITGVTSDCSVFQMGVLTALPGRNVPNRRHLVRLTNNFEIQATDVTQLQWLMVMKGTSRAAPSFVPSRPDDCNGIGKSSYQIENQSGVIETVTICPNNPVTDVSYNDIVGPNGFLARLNAGQDQYFYRLPTEAEWEYASRGSFVYDDGTYPNYFFGDHSLYPLYAHYAGNSRGYSHPVATKLPNDYGIFDVFGDVKQWVSDCWEDNYGLSESQLAAVTTDPAGVDDSECRYHVIRGNAWYDLPIGYSRFSGPDSNEAHGLSGVGFRLVRTLR